MIAIIDYGMGNVGSVKNMLKKVGVHAELTRDRKHIEAATGLILPGVGAFDMGMTNLAELDLIPLLNEMVLVRRVPILGICLGMQLFSASSTEGNLPGLGWIDARCVKFEKDEANNIRVPHMGWNEIIPNGEPPFFVPPSSAQQSRFYFVHSYYLQCASEEDILATCVYGKPFAAAVWHENIVGVQFHPEKSHKFGMSFFHQYFNEFVYAETKGDSRITA